MNWLFLRGLTREQRHWGDFPKTFEALVPNSKVFCLDLPGVGTEFRRPSPTTIEEFAEDLRERWLELKSKTSGEWNLFSISLGSMIALSWVAKYPEDFSKLVMINSSAANLSPIYHRLDWKIWAKTIFSLFIKDPLQREAHILRLTSKGRFDIMDRAAHWAKIAQDAPSSKSVAIKQVAAAIRFCAPKNISLPMLVLSSKGDRFTNPQCSVELASFYDAPLQVHPDAGHDLPMDEGEWVAKQVGSWVKTQKT